MWLGTGGKPRDVSYYVINKSTVAAASGYSVSSGSVYLGRPWSDYARVVFQNTDLSSIINSAGWKIWSTSTPNTDYVLFGEYGNTGSGASGTRASFSTKLSSPIAITDILGSGYTSWVDTSYLSGSSSTTTTTKTSTTTTKTTTTTTKTSTTTAGSSTGPAAHYAQCGGIGYTGPTTCVSPYVCTYSNDYYLQCI